VSASSLAEVYLLCACLGAELSVFGVLAGGESGQKNKKQEERYMYTSSRRGYFFDPTKQGVLEQLEHRIDT